MNTQDDLIPNPEQCGRIIGRSINLLSLLNEVSELEQQLLTTANLDAQYYLSERFALACASVFAVVSDLPISVKDASGLRQGFFSLIQNRLLVLKPPINTLGQLDDLASYYVSAVNSDLSVNNESISFSNLEHAFADRLMNQHNENEEKDIACIKLSLSLPKILWQVQIDSTKQVLVKAGIIKLQ